MKFLDGMRRGTDYHITQFGKCKKNTFIKKFLTNKFVIIRTYFECFFSNLIIKHKNIHDTLSRKYYRYYTIYSDSFL